MPSLLRPDLYYKQVVIRLYLVKMTVILGRRGFHGGSDGKASACNAGDPGSIPELGRSPGEGNGNPLQYSCLKNSMDREAWGGYSPWDHRESDMTERLHFLSLGRKRRFNEC